MSQSPENVMKTISQHSDFVVFLRQGSTLRRLVGRWVRVDGSALLFPSGVHAHGPIESERQEPLLRQPDAFLFIPVHAIDCVIGGSPEICQEIVQVHGQVVQR